MSVARLTPNTITTPIAERAPAPAPEATASGTAPAFAIYMPVMRMNQAGVGPGERGLAGFVYTPFRAREFLDAAIDRQGEGRFGVRLYDGEVNTGHLLVAHSISDAASASAISARVPFSSTSLLSSILRA